MNGSLAENGRQADYWIAPTPARVQPGQQAGQPFTVYNFSWESSAAAGVCSWNNLLYGVIVDRQPIAGTPGTTDENSWEVVPSLVELRVAAPLIIRLP
jgi:hypothetical protein